MAEQAVILSFYRIMKQLFLVVFSCFLLLSCQTSKHSGIIAHRGYWNTEGSHENSLSSLKNAMALGVYGSECDVRQTKDGVLVLFHNSRLDDGRAVAELNFEQLTDYRLPNGEAVPTFDEILPMSRTLVRELGVYRDQLPAIKEVSP